MNLRAITLVLVVMASVGVVGAPSASAAPPEQSGKPDAPASGPFQPPAHAFIRTIDVPQYHQQHPLSCEASALSMVLAYEGHPPKSASPADQKSREDRIMSRIPVDRSHWWAGPGSTETAQQRDVAGDPFTSFVGDIDGKETTGTQSGYGTYYATIAKAAAVDKVYVVRSGQGLDPIVLGAQHPGAGEAGIYDALLRRQPVQVWVTFDLNAHDRDDYTTHDGKRVTYAGPWEHSMVLTGISLSVHSNGIHVDGVRVNDPDGKATTPERLPQYWVPAARFEAAYKAYGNMAVIFPTNPKKK